jgi:hypothetical protein
MPFSTYFPRVEYLFLEASSVRHFGWLQASPLPDFARSQITHLLWKWIRKQPLQQNASRGLLTGA